MLSSDGKDDDRKAAQDRAQRRGARAVSRGASIAGAPLAPRMQCSTLVANVNLLGEAMRSLGFKKGALMALLIVGILALLHNLASMRAQLGIARAALEAMQAHDLGAYHRLPSGESIGHVPIFIIHRDRPTLLRALVRSLRVIDARLTPFAIVIHDMQSSNPEALRTLDELEASGQAPVNHAPRILVERDQFVDAALAEAVARDAPVNERISLVLNRVRSTIDKYINSHPDVQYYVVTDPDVVLAPDMPGDVLALSALLLQLRPDLAVVAPALRIDDLPMNLCRSQVIQNHEVQFWHAHAHSIQAHAVRRYFSAPVLVDTTFGMYRSSFSFRRLNGGARLHPPYWVQHEPWYQPLAREDWSAEQRYYVEHALPITAWTQALHGPPGAASDLDRQYELALAAEYGLNCSRLRRLRS